MSKYKYCKDLKIYSFLNPPVVLPLLPLMQKLMRAFYLTDMPDKGLIKEKIRIPVKGGEIDALVYTSVKADKVNSPCIIFYHGGGFVYNAAPHHFTLAKNLAKALKIKVVFPDYRLAPKHPFPTAVEDAFAAYLYISESSESLGIDKSRIALCGDSAGGNLSAVSCLIARDRGVTPPCGQMLLYPFVDADNQSESMLRFTDTPMCNSKAAEQYNRAYIPDESYSPKEWFSAVDAENHANLPEAYIETAEFDCLHDGGVKYYKKLTEAGSKALLVETKGTMHGYDIATKSQTYADCMKKRIGFFEKIFNNR